MAEGFRCGYVAIVGRPNVGKSTLMNRAVGQKVSITAPKPQTTRHQIIGIHSRDDAQILYLDTPGLHIKEPRALNRYLNRAASSVLQDADVVLFVVQALQWTAEDEAVLERLSGLAGRVILVINQVDRVRDRVELLPYIEQLSAKAEFAEVVPVSARSGDNLEALEDCIVRYLPESEPFYPEDMVTTRSERFVAAEAVREHITRLLHAEVPYSVTVEIEQFKDEPRITRISAVIWVEREGQKKILIGRGGSQLKRIGERARKELEEILDRKVFLQLWVKVKAGWADDERALRSLGFED